MDFFVTEVATRIRQELEHAEWAKFGVSFWGEEAISLLGIDHLKRLPLEIVCNLESGACNPAVIKRLLNKREFPNVSILTNSRLHAKVYLTNKCLITGSANASANGLGLEGTELKGWLEALTYTENQAARTAASSWFDGLRKQQISADLMKEARRRWIINRMHRNSIDSCSSKAIDISEILSRQPQFFKDRNIYVFAYTDNCGEKLEKQEKKIKSKHNITADTYYSDAVKKRYRPNSFFIDLQYHGKYSWPNLPDYERKFVHFRDKRDIYKSNVKEEPYIIYVFYQKNLSVGGVKINISKRDINLIHNNLILYYKKHATSAKNMLSGDGQLVLLHEILTA